ncbi:MAG: HAD family phosphatase [Dysgonamonadaceae bacterium]|jgi:HAD superfamily hydrolase (TIGR01509 family)|nr:HAD family phosphatase [Dysgonamonadaceae bacterium]
MCKQLKTPGVLFDLDGVIVDTEAQYDIFWQKTSVDYQLGIADFEHKIKGTTLDQILLTYFSHLSVEEREELCRASRDFEKQMVFHTIPGAMDFIRKLKEASFRIGLVTSSDDEKLKKVFHDLSLDGVFDTVVSANRITKGKPHPMCYLLAAEDLDIPPAQCIVFEDSFPGIAAGNAAGMTVIGLATTNPESQIKDLVYRVIPNFEDLSSLLPVFQLFEFSR